MVSKRITFSVPQAFHTKVKLKTIREGTSIRNVAVHLLEKYLKKEVSNGDVKYKR